MSKLLWPLSLAIIVAVLFVLMERDEGPAVEVAQPDAALAGTAPQREAQNLRDVGVSQTERTPQIEPATPAPSDPEPRAEAPFEGTLVRGRVVGVDGVGTAGFEIKRADDEGPLLATTDAAGAFEFPLPAAERITLTAERSDWVTVHRSVLDAWTAEREHVIVVSPAVDLAGRVVDEVGLAVAGAKVSVELGDQYLSEVRLPLDMTSKRRFEAESDDDGSFELEAVPAARGTRLSGRAAGHETEQRAVPSVSDRALLVELTRLDPEDDDPARIVGTVLRPDLSPAARAQVAFASFEGQCDAAGGFEIPISDIWGYQDESPLVAAQEGHGPAVAARYGELLRLRLATLDSESAAPQGPIDDIVLVLTNSTFELAGRVVDEAGAPLAGWLVTLADPTEISRGRVPPILAESLALNAVQDTTGADGAFRLAGLLLRNYRLMAYDAATLVRVETEPFLAGRNDVEIVVPGGLVHDALSGRVVALGGEPIAGAQVSVKLVTYQSGGATSYTGTDPIATDEDGRFALENVPRLHAYLSIAGEEVVPTKHEIPEGDFEGDLQITVAQRCHFRVEVHGSQLDGLRVQALDAEGTSQQITVFSSSGWGAGHSQALNDDGTMRVCAISEVVRSIVLLRGDEELARQEVTLVPGRVNEIRFDLP